MGRPRSPDPQRFNPPHSASIPKRGRRKVDPTGTAAKVIQFAEFLKVPAGKFMGQPIRLRLFQKRFIEDLYGPRDPAGLARIRQAVLSMARKNGKTVLIAILLLAHLVGPLRRMNSIIVSAANDTEQAALVFKYAADIVRQTPELMSRLKIVESTYRIVNPGLNSYYKAISAEAHTKLGSGPDLVIYDELGAAKNRDLYNALSTSQSAQAEPLFLAMSTQAPTDAHLLSELIDYGKKINQGIVEDPAFLLHLYETPLDVEDIFNQQAWQHANPALGDYRSLEEMQTAARRVKEMPASEPAFRNLYLNQRVQAHAPFVAPSVWQRNKESNETDRLRDLPLYGGLDLSGKNDLTCLIFVAEDTDRTLHTWIQFFAPEEGVFERGHRDRVPYKTWADQGFITLTPGPTVDYSWIAYRLKEIADDYEVAQINFDRWRIEDLERELVRVDADTIPLEKFGQGFRDMGPAVDLLETQIQKGRLRGVLKNPVMTWCMSNTVIVTDPAGSRKFDKAKSYGRIDGSVALAMAVKACLGGEDDASAYETGDLYVA